MLPKTMSASSMKVASGCLARFAATHMAVTEELGRAQRTDTGLAALLGTAVHNSLEWFVKTYVMTGKDWRNGLEGLLGAFDMFYMKGFGTLEKKSVEYKDGVKMLKEWHARTDFDTFTVVSCEQKTSFPVTITNTTEGPSDQLTLFEADKHTIPFNYIWDRFDRLDQEGEEVYRVVDYKTNRWGYSPDDLRDLLQARVYGLAAQIQYPNASLIWVEFDMLRHKGPVAVSFTRADNIETWRYIKRILKEIGETDQANAPETLNDECHWCIRKQRCSALKANAMVGGIMSLDDVYEMGEQRTQLAFQLQGTKAALDELDNAIMRIALEEDVVQFDLPTGEHNLKVGAQNRRSIDADTVERIIGPDLWKVYGSRTIRMGDLDELLTGSVLTDEQKAQINRAIQWAPGNPSVKSVKKRAR